MNNCFSLFFAAFLSAIFPLTSATAETRNVFVHELTGTEFPAEIEGLVREEMQQYGEKQFDISFQYVDEIRSTFLSIYVYRAGLPDVPIGFNRLLAVVTERPGFEPADPKAVVAKPFIPPGHSVMSGLRTSFAVNGSRLSATAASLAPYGDWLIKIRATSKNHDPDQLNALIDATYEQLVLPDEIGEPANAYLVTACETPLSFENAKQIKVKPEEAIALATLYGGAGTVRNQTDGVRIWPKPVRYCKDSHSTEGYGVYRADGATDAYVMAFGDAGDVVSVGAGRGLIDQATSRKNRVTVALQLAEGNRIYRPFNKLPSPEQIVNTINDQPPIAFSDRINDISISSDK